MTEFTKPDLFTVKYIKVDSNGNITKRCIHTIDVARAKYIIKDVYNPLDSVIYFEDSLEYKKYSLKCLLDK